MLLPGNYKTSTCTATPFNVTVIVNPTAVVTSSSSNVACSGQPEGYVITSNIPTATFSWSRPTVGTNPAVFNKTSSTINETLINNGLTPLTAIYTIIPIANGCNGTPFLDTVSINPTVFQPVANGNSPVCRQYYKVAAPVMAIQLIYGPAPMDIHQQIRTRLSITRQLPKAVIAP